MYITEPQSVFAAHDNAKIVVNSSEELSAAIKALGSTGGTIYMATSDEPYGIDIRNTHQSEDNAIRITSLEPDNEAVVHGIFARDISYFNFDGFTIDSSSVATTRGDWLADAHVQNSNNVSLTDLSIHGTATQTLDGTAGVLKGENGIKVTNSESILIADNEMSHLAHAIELLGVRNSAVVDNHIYAVQGDGIRGGGIQETLMDGNYMHDFLGATYDVYHTDFIQLWTKWPVGETNHTVTISNNMLDSAEGAAAQGIFINNEAFGIKGDPLEGVHGYDIVITGNVVHTGMFQGISVTNYNNVDVHDNTVLWNEAATVAPTAGAEMINDRPWIMVRGGQNAAVTGNVSEVILTEDHMQTEDNFILDYENASSPNFAYDHVIGLSPFGTSDPSALQFRPDSPLNDSYGAPQSVWTPSDFPIDPVITATAVSGNRAALEFSADLTTVDGALIDIATSRFIWTFEDGKTYEGPTIVRSFDGSGAPAVAALDIQLADGRSISDTMKFQSGTEEIVSINFGANDGGLADLQYALYDPAGGALRGDALSLDKTTHLEVRPDRADVTNLDTLNINLDFKPESFTSGDDWLMYWRNGIEIRITEEQGLWVTVETDQGKFSGRSEEGVLDAGKWSNIDIQYDGLTNELVMSVDDEQVGSFDVAGDLNANTHAFYLGMPFHARSAEGEVANLDITSPPSARFEESASGVDDQQSEQDLSFVVPVVEIVPEQEEDQSGQDQDQYQYEDEDQSEQQTPLFQDNDLSVPPQQEDVAEFPVLEPGPQPEPTPEPVAETPAPEPNPVSVEIPIEVPSSGDDEDGAFDQWAELFPDLALSGGPTIFVINAPFGWRYMPSSSDQQSDEDNEDMDMDMMEGPLAVLLRLILQIFSQSGTGQLESLEDSQAYTITSPNQGTTYDLLTGELLYDRSQDWQEQQDDLDEDWMAA